MNWLDRAISTLSPEAGIRRARARAALRVIEGIEQRGGYDGAKRGRRTQGWTATGDSGNSALFGQLDTLRNRSRDLVRNNPYAKKAVSTIVRHMVRDGIQAVWDNQGAAKAWRAWCRQADWRGETTLAGLQAQVARAWKESGEALVRRHILPEYDGRTIPVRYEVLEPDYLATFETRQLPDGFIIAGVEYGNDGRRRAYWMYDYHPGETIPVARNLTPRRVPAEEILHIRSVVHTRPGQVRGVPQLGSALLRLRDLDEYQEAELVRKKIEACFAVFVTSTSGNAASIPGVGSAVDSGTGKRIETVAPGLIEYLDQDQDVRFGQPSASPNDGYTREQLHAIAAGAECTYEQLTGDLSGVNYSSIRAGRLEFFALIQQEQWLELIPQLCDPIARDVMRIGYIAGAIRARDLEPTDWTCPKPEFVDPLKDVLALKESARGGLISISEAQRLNGQDPETVRAEMKREREEFAKDGIVVDTDARVKLPANSVGAQADGSPAATATTE